MRLYFILALFKYNDSLIYRHRSKEGNDIKGDETVIEDSTRGKSTKERTLIPSFLIEKEISDIDVKKAIASERFLYLYAVQ